jgi:hypothetical protein
MAVNRANPGADAERSPTLTGKVTGDAEAWLAERVGRADQTGDERSSETVDGR